MRGGGPVSRRLSLRAQAVAWLAQREHSELELRRKLLRRLEESAARDALAGDATQAEPSTAQARGSPGDGPGSQDGAACPFEPAHQVDAVIAWLVERGYLDLQRFIDSRVHVRAGRYGLGRIQHELSQHGLSLAPEAVQALRSTEFDRAQALWQRRFGEPAQTPRDAARQARFLAGRGFSGEVVRRVLRAGASVSTVPPHPVEPD